MTRHPLESRRKNQIGGRRVSHPMKCMDESHSAKFSNPSCDPDCHTSKRFALCRVSGIISILDTAKETSFIQLPQRFLLWKAAVFGANVILTRKFDARAVCKFGGYAKNIFMRKLYREGHHSFEGGTDFKKIYKCLKYTTRNGGSKSSVNSVGSSSLSFRQIFEKDLQKQI
jgi:hypothetical protein